MKKRFEELLHTDFRSFVSIAFKCLHESNAVQAVSYIDYLACELSKLATRRQQPKLSLT